jgi:peptidoglycan hydrolase-like protein with peptidoglycan-binding domain
MRVIAAFSALVLVSGAVLAQDAPAPAAKPAAAAKPTPKPKPAATATSGKAEAETSASKQSVRDSYNAIPVAERMSLQSDLVWTGDYNGLVNGEFSERLVAAVKAFQKRNKTKETGVLNLQERAALTASAKPRQDEVGWKLLDDPVTGARLGVPGKLVPQASQGKSGTRWASAQGQLQVETFRITNTTLEAAYEQQRREPVGRKPSYNVIRPNESFVVSGMQGLKKFYVRGFARDGEVRGITILYDQAEEGTMDPMVVAMSSAFLPFGSALTPDGQPVRRKVEYATGLIVSSSGHIVTDKQAVEGCQVIAIPGHGNAERVVEDKSGDLALIRLHGARNMTPIGLLGAAAPSGNVTLIGIADPQAQGGGSVVGTVAGRTNGTTLDTAPSLGFSGAAALDAQGKFAGMVVLKTAVVAGAVSAPQASLVTPDKLTNFLDANYVTAASGTVGIEAAKTSVVRVICIRK